ncbi:MAG: NAD-dependent protein deacylase [Chloroflexi bacterium]|nr:MAG: NAD-dependent protein deacylase [Chloroflexota bacterium]
MGGEIQRAAQLLRQADFVVCLTGAGVSAESGVATFRDAQTGLWSHFDPRQLASQEGFAEDPGLVWRWYMERLETVGQVQPNPGHMALAQIERLVPRFVLFTQNIDDLHERAGSQNVRHLHGTITRFRCNDCGMEHLLQPVERSQDTPPACRWCGGLVRPDVVWFGELLPQDVLAEARRSAETCDVLLVVGTSGVVYPAAELPLVAQSAGAQVIDVNPEAGAIAEIADLFLQGAGGEILPRLVAAMKENNGTDRPS